MTVRYLLDTNVLSEPLKPSPDKKVLITLQKCEQYVATASLVIQEIQFGCYRLPISERRKEIQRYLKHIRVTMPVLPYNETAALWHGEERARLSKVGLTPAFVDGQIAAIAKTNNLILVTRNVIDFTYFTELEIENWFA